MFSRLPRFLHQRFELAYLVLGDHRFLLDCNDLLVLLVLNVDVGLNEFFEHLSRSCFHLERFHLVDGIEFPLSLKQGVNLNDNVLTEFSQILRQL